ncbi:MAG: hypothetical protein LAT63_10670 [Marinobacter sp.]|nr:hypothetical protein [Marinobacter sp.]
MIDMPLDILIGFIGLGGGFCMLVGLLVLRITLTRRLKKKLKATGEYWATGTLDFGFLNTAMFAWACTMPWFQRLKKYQLIYPGLDVRAFANWFERAVAYGTIYGLMVAFLFLSLSYGLDALCQTNQ